MIDIAPLRSADIADVVAIDESCYSEPWSTKVWAAEVAASSRYHVVARLDGAVVGHAGILFVRDVAHVITVAVHPDRHGRGIATTMLLAVVNYARSVGARASALEVRASAYRTQRLYGRLGFVPAGIRRSYYDDAEDAVVMRLNDLNSAQADARLLRVADELAVKQGSPLQASACLSRVADELAVKQGSPL